MNIEIDTHNFANIEQGLAGLTERLARQAINGAISYGATPMLKDARNRASKAEHDHLMKYGNSKILVHPGLLKQSLRRRRLKKGELAQLGASAGYALYVGKGKTQKLYPRYWHFIEFGTSKMPSIPYWRPAFETNKRLFVERFCQKMAQNIAKYTPISQETD